MIPVALSKHKTVVEVNEDNLEGPQHTEEQSMQHGKTLTQGSIQDLLTSTAYNNPSVQKVSNKAVPEAQMPNAPLVSDATCKGRDIGGGWNYNERHWLQIQQ